MYVDVVLHKHKRPEQMQAVMNGHPVAAVFYLQVNQIWRADVKLNVELWVLMAR